MAHSSDERQREEELKTQLRPEARERLIGRIERFLDLERWGFHLSYVVPKSKNDKVIYDSPWCRVKFTLLIDLREGDEMAIWYARSHVPNDVELVME